MPAECLIGDPCGVQAVGMCLRCRRPFCMTHQGRRPSDYATFSDLCSLCAPLQVEENYRASQQGRTAVARLFISSGAARKMLQDAGAPTVQLSRYELQVQRQRSRFGRSVDVPMPTLISDARGWLLGELGWKWRDGSDSTGVDVAGLRLTALLDEPGGDVKRSESGLVIVNVHDDRYAMFYDSIRTDFAPIGYSTAWDKAAEAVRRLAGR